MPAAPKRTAHVAAYEAYLKGIYWLERRTPGGAPAGEGRVRGGPGAGRGLPAGAGRARVGPHLLGGVRLPGRGGSLQRARRGAPAGRAARSPATRWRPRPGSRGPTRGPSRSCPRTRSGTTCDRARRLTPNSADIAMAYAWSLFRAGKTDSALAEARRGLALDPLAPGLRHSLVALAIGARRYDVALARGPARAPGGAIDPVSAILQAYAQLLSGRAARMRRAGPGSVGRGPRDVPPPDGPERRGGDPGRFAGPRARRGALRVPPPVRRPRRLLRVAGRCGPVAPLDGARLGPFAHAAPVAAQVGAVRPGVVAAGVSRPGSPGRGRWPKNGFGPAAPPSGSERRASRRRVPLRRTHRRAAGRARRGALAARPAAAPGSSARLYRDVYVDTSDNALAARGITCRIRYGADDRRTLTLGVAEPGLPGARAQRGLSRRRSRPSRPARHPRGDSEPARRLRGVIDPARLEPRFELEVERLVRTACRPWPLPGRFAFHVRPGDGAEWRASRASSGAESAPPSRRRPAARGGRARARAGARPRPVLQTKMARARELLRQMGRERSIRNLDPGGRSR